MKFLAIGGEKYEPGTLWSTNVKDIYVFNNPITGQVSEQSYIQVWPQNNDYEHWQLSDIHYTETGNNGRELKKQKIFEDKHASKKPILRAVGIKQENLIALTEDLNLTILSRKTGISVDHLSEILEIAKPNLSKTG